MVRPPLPAFLGWSILLSVAACGGAAGEVDSEILVPFSGLGGGIVFATAGISGSSGYDLYWVPIPPPSSVSPQPFLRLTDAGGNEWQPSAARDGSAIAFASDDGIRVITSSGRIKEVSNTVDTPFNDSLPAVHPSGTQVAWVREDTSREIPGTLFFETWIMIADVDGQNARTVSPRPGVVQDAPVFDPNSLNTRLAWSEFDPKSIVGAVGPTVYGIFIYNYQNETGAFVCQSENGLTPGTEFLPQRPDRFYRCFGQHMVWPIPEILVLPQDFLEIEVMTGALSSVWSEVVVSLQVQQLGVPFIEPRGDGFFPAFPISASYAPDGSIMVFDGVLTSVEGDEPSLSLFVASSDGSNVRRLLVDGLTNDVDTANTASYLFSRATPQIIPFLSN